MRALAAGLAVALCLACAAQGPPYHHSRYDYWAFKARVGKLPEPNYLPWITHVEPLPGGGTALVACRWPDSAFPLRYHVIAPLIPLELQDEFSARDPRDYVAAVKSAFSMWEQAVGRPLRFVAVEDPAQATLHVRLRAESYRAEDVRVLGVVRDAGDRCRVLGAGKTPEAVPIAFAVPEAELFVVDAHGLLTPNQVRTVALHEIGHILGASGQHSPLSGDVMFPVADDSRVEKISEHDRNTFRALYRLPPGSVYARLAAPHAEPLSEVRRGPPRLGERRSDERLDFSVSFPVGWQVIRARTGWVAVDGVSWDYDASVQVVSLRGRVDAFVEQHRRRLQRRGELESTEVIEIDGARITRVLARGDGWAEETSVQEWGDGWLLVMVADSAARDYSLYRAWFELVMLSIDRPSRTRDAGGG